MIRRWSAAVATGLVVGAGLVGCTSGRSGPAPESTATASVPRGSNEAPTRTNSIDPSASPVPTRDPQAGAAESAARAFAGSYLARTYQETATAWTSRLSPLATARLVAELRAGVASPAQWAALVAARTIVRVVVNSAAVATGFHGTDNLRLVEVGYVSTTQTSAGMSAPVSTSLRVMLSLVDGQWRADHLIPVTQ